LIRLPEKLTFMSTPSPNRLVARHPAPLETLAIPAAPDGHAGTNRAMGGHAQIAAANDLEAIRAWLARFAGGAVFRGRCRKAVRPSAS
jgi:hypothetical protein